MIRVEVKLNPKTAPIYALCALCSTHEKFIITLISRQLLCLNSGSASFEEPGLLRRVLQRDLVNQVSCC